MTIQKLFSDELTLFKTACEKCFLHIHGQILGHNLRFFSLSRYKRFEENRFFSSFKRNADVSNPPRENGAFNGLLSFDDYLILHYINYELGMPFKNGTNVECRKNVSPMQKRIAESLFVKMTHLMNCELREDTQLSTIDNNCEYIIEYSVSIQIFGRLCYGYIAFPYILQKEESVPSTILEQLTSTIEVSSETFSITGPEPLSIDHLYIDQQIVLPRHMLQNLHIVCNNHTLFKGILGKKNTRLAVKITTPS